MNLSVLKYFIPTILVFLFASNLARSNPDTLSLKTALERVAESRKNKNADGLADALRDLAARYLIERDNPDEAVKAYTEAIGVLEVYDDSAGIYEIYMDLGMLHTSMGQFHLAINYYDAAADFFKIRDDSISMGVAFNFTGDAYIGASMINQAIPFVTEASKLTSPTSILARVNNNTITALMRNGHDLRDMSKIVDTAQVDRAPSAVITQNYKGLAQLNSGYYQFRKGNLPLAEYYFDQVLKDSDSGEILREALSYLAELNKQRGDFEAAFAYLSQYSSVNDSLLSEKRQQIINRLRIEMEINDKKQEIRDLQSEQKVQAILNKTSRVSAISLLIASLIILIGAYLAIRNYQRRLSVNQIIHSQNEEINQSRITELENNLKIETMQSMINGQEVERERVAKELHDSLGGLLSTVKLHFDALQSNREGIEESKEYQKAYSLLDMACNEVRSIANNMQPDALLSMGLVPAINDLINRAQSAETPRIEFQYFDVNGQLDPTASLNIYRIVQELINNSIKHANASEILVQLLQKDDELMITVEDDGIGFDPEEVKTGMGTGNIASRVNFLKGEISVHTGPGEGTSTLVTVPVS